MLTDCSVLFSRWHVTGDLPVCSVCFLSLIQVTACILPNCFNVLCLRTLHPSLLLQTMWNTVCFSTALSDSATLFWLLARLGAIWLVFCHPADDLFFLPAGSSSFTHLHSQVCSALEHDVAHQHCCLNVLGTTWGWHARGRRSQTPFIVPWHGYDV